MIAHERIILPLDVSTTDEAASLVSRLREHVGAFKIGLELINACGWQVFDAMRDVGADRIFYDCKLHDIPNTVAGAARAIGRRGLWMMNLHAAGGRRMMAAGVGASQAGAVEAGMAAPLVLGVTLLTSIAPAELADELHVDLPVADYVTRMARMAQATGARGVVASPKEIHTVRAACGAGFLIVTPGVRPAWAEQGDQRRVMTPADAIQAGADYLVIGRPITGAKDPVAAALRIADEIDGG